MGSFLYMYSKLFQAIDKPFMRYPNWLSLAQINTVSMFETENSLSIDLNKSPLRVGEIAQWVVLAAQE